MNIIEHHNRNLMLDSNFLCILSHSFLATHEQIDNGTFFEESNLFIHQFTSFNSLMTRHAWIVLCLLLMFPVDLVPHDVVAVPGNGSFGGGFISRLHVRAFHPPLGVCHPLSYEIVR